MAIEMQHQESWADVKAQIAEKYADKISVPVSADCQHEATEYRKLKTANGVEQLRKQCMTCGELVGAALRRDTVADFSSLHGVDEELRSRRDKQWSQRQQARAQYDGETDSAFWDYYSRYMTSAEWQQRRYLVLRRANGVCEGCGLRPPEHVHHSTYQHLGEEFLFELLALCRECHHRIHPHRDLV